MTSDISGPSSLDGGVEGTGDAAAKMHSLRLRVQPFESDARRRVVISRVEGEELKSRLEVKEKLLDTAVELDLSGEVSLRLPAPAAAMGAEASPLFTVTIYEDVDESGSLSWQDRYLAASVEFVAPASVEAGVEWQYYDPRSGEFRPSAEGVLELLRIDRERKSPLVFGGARSDIPKNVDGIALISSAELQDLHQNFDDTRRAVNFRLIPDSRPAWEHSTAVGMNPNRFQNPFGGLGKHGREWLIAYANPDGQPEHSLLNAKSNFVAALCHGDRAAVMMWVHPSRWIENVAGAHFAARYGFAPGWNMLGVDPNNVDDFVLLNAEQCRELTIRPKCR